MCRSKEEGERRCSACLKTSLRGVEGSIERITNKINQAERGLLTYEGVNYALMEEVDAAKSKRQGLLLDLREANRKYNASKHGLLELQAKMADPSLTPGQRELARKDLEQAMADREETKKLREEFYLKQESLRNDFRRQGVPDDAIKSIIQQAKQDKGNSHPRGAPYYWTALEKARKMRVAARDSYDRNVNTILTGNLSEEQKKRELALEDARFEKNDAALKQKCVHYRLGYDRTTTGQKELLEQTEAAVAKIDKKIEDAWKQHDLEEVEGLIFDRSGLLAQKQERIQRVKRLYDAGMSDHKAREIIRNQIIAAVRSVGGDPKAALKAWKQPTKTVYRPDPMTNKFATSIHLTDADKAKLDKAFQKSPEFKAQGVEGFNDFVNRKLMANPLSKMGAQSLDEVTAEAPKFDQGKSGRHKTSVDGNRINAARVMVSNVNKQILRARANALHMSLSSYCRAMTLDDGNPFEIQNDRSRKHHKAKLDKCSEILREGALAA